jgi:uncharacterized membrane protein YphA (DoxX/SURF4 family)
MYVGTCRSWNVRAIVITRTFLAATLLLSASVRVSHLTFYGALAFVFELLLGAAIAAGWLTRYAAALVLLGTIAERVLILHFQLPFIPPSRGTTVALLIASAMLACLGWNTDKVGATLIDETNQLSSEHACAAPHARCYEEAEVTIRLEDGQLRSPRKHRCVVTIHDRPGGAQNKGQEVWYAREDR